MKRVNSIIGLISTLTLIGHICTTMIFLTLGIRNELLSNILARSTYGLILAHVLISLTILIREHDASPVAVKYVAKTYRVWIQRISGLFILIFLHSHIGQMVKVINEVSMVAADKVRFAIINITFFVVLYTHLSVSISRALLSLGIVVDTKAIDRTDRIVMVTCVILCLVTCGTIVNFIVGY